MRGSNDQAQLPAGTKRRDCQQYSRDQREMLNAREMGRVNCSALLAPGLLEAAKHAVLVNFVGEVVPVQTKTTEHSGENSF